MKRYPSIVTKKVHDNILGNRVGNKVGKFSHILESVYVTAIFLRKWFYILSDSLYVRIRACGIINATVRYECRVKFLQNWHQIQ